VPVARALPNPRRRRGRVPRRSVLARQVTKEERRDFSRIALKRPATLETAGRRTPCELVDVSLRGALLKVPPRLGVQEGQSCALRVRLDEGAAFLQMSGVVAHVGEGTVGIRSRIADLDTIAHIRRLLEVNLDDERLLHREFAALVKRRRR